jgi:hypothetical protein
MPFYRFHIETHEPALVVMERLKAIVRPKSGFWESFRMTRWQSDPSSPPLIGKVENDSFRVRRDIRYRNSFLPLVWGHVQLVGVGTRITGVEARAEGQCERAARLLEGGLFNSFGRVWACWGDVRIERIKRSQLPTAEQK